MVDELCGEPIAIAVFWTDKLCTENTTHAAVPCDLGVMSIDHLRKNGHHTSLMTVKTRRQQQQQ